jgi:E1A/CREB-binding protein
MELLIRRQVEDQLPGGKFSKPSADVLAQTSSCPTTNLITERDFAHLDQQLKSKPNISTLAVTGSVMFLNNKTCAWMQSLPPEEKAHYMQTARKKAPLLKKKYHQRRIAIRRKLNEKMEKKEQEKEKRVTKAKVMLKVKSAAAN